MTSRSMGGISANVNSIFGLFTTHFFTNLTPFNTRVQKLNNKTFFFFLNSRLKKSSTGLNRCNFVDMQGGMKAHDFFDNFSFLFFRNKSIITVVLFLLTASCFFRGGPSLLFFLDPNTMWVFTCWNSVF